MELELVWARPLGAAFLVLPALLVLVARARARPVARATGTFAVWKRIAAATPVPARRERRRVPPAVWLLAAALALGALALAGPRLERPAAPRAWTVVVDHSPSTALPWVPPGTAPEPGAPPGETRLERALALARGLLAEHVRPRDRVRWISSARPSLVLEGAALPPPAWRAPPAWPAPEPDLALHDRAGVIVVTDRAPQTAAAGVAASGGGAVPGPVGWEDDARVDWDGTGLVRVPDAVGPRAVEARGELPAPLARLLASWAAARGLELRPADGAAALRVEVEPGAGEPREVELARDGWRARAVVPAAGLPAPADGLPWRPWLAAGELPVVARAPGRVRLALRALAEPEGDPAAFAVSWAELLDEALLPPAGVVALAERRAAGEALVRAPLAPPAEEGAAPRAFPLDAALALGAALLALASAAAGLLGQGVATSRGGSGSSSGTWIAP